MMEGRDPPLEQRLGTPVGRLIDGRLDSRPGPTEPAAVDETEMLPAAISAAEAAALMVKRRRTSMRVMGADGRAMGVVTALDLLSCLAQEASPVEPTVEETASAAPSEQRLVENDRLAALGSLAGGIAHQMNNALAFMRLGIGRLISLERSRQPLTPIREHRLEVLHDIREGVVRIERINEELIHFSRMDSGPATSIDLPPLLDETLGLVAAQIRYRARLARDFGEVPPVRGREAVFRQLFVHLILNAAQAIPDGQAHLNLIRVVTRTDSAGRAVVEISDTGAGIAPQDMVRIFEPFFTTRQDAQHLGLGLSICRDLVAALGGELSAESVVGEGTTMRVVLPASASHSVPNRERVAFATAARSEGWPCRRVLLVDDEVTLNRLLKRELEEEQIEVVATTSGPEALKLLARDRDFDVILCDLMMPEMSGADFYEAVKLVDPHLLARFAFMTGGAFTERASQFLGAVSNPYIAKPFHFAELLTMVRAQAAAAGAGAAVESPGSAATTPHRGP
jgi:two-component system cell cycle sensor histidine kinase/response regulator CckA